MVETCRETLMKLSLTDAENANLDPSETTHLETLAKEEIVTVDKECVDIDTKDIKVQMSVDEDSTGNSTDELPGEVVAMSTDDSDREISTSLPQTPTTPDENKQ